MNGAITNNHFQPFAFLGGLSDATFMQRSPQAGEVAGVPHPTSNNPRVDRLRRDLFFPHFVCLTDISTNTLLVFYFAVRTAFVVSGGILLAF